MPDVWTEPLEDANSCEEFAAAFVFFGATAAIASVISLAAMGSSEWIGLSGAYAAAVAAMTIPIVARPKSVAEPWEFEEEEESARESGSNASVACAVVLFEIRDSVNSPGSFLADGEFRPFGLSE